MNRDTRRGTARRSLSRDHFAFLRGVVSGVDPKQLWPRYMALEGRFDPRSADRTLRELRDELAAVARRGARHRLARLVSMDLSALPLLPDVLGLAGKGFLTGGGMSNREFAGGEVRADGKLATDMEMLLYDPQTSGGLLVTVTAGNVDAYIEAVRGRGAEDAAIIGEVLKKGESSIVLKI